MSLEKAFVVLRESQGRLVEMLKTLRDAVAAEERRPNPDLALVDQRSEVVENLIGLAEEAHADGREGVVASRPPIDIDAARAALVKSQESFNSLSQGFNGHLASYDAMAELAGIGMEHGPAWEAWAVRVWSAINGCVTPIYEVNQALFGCWREIAERAGMNSVSVRTTAIGQKITMPDRERASSEGRI